MLPSHRPRHTVTESLHSAIAKRYLVVCPFIERHEQMTTPAPQPAAPQPAGPLTEAEDKQWASFAHFGGAVVLLGLILGWIGLIAIVPALVIFLVFGKRGPRTLVESKEALNFQITVVGALIIWTILSTIIINAVAASITTFEGLALLGTVGLLLGLVALAIIVIDVIFSIIGGVKVQGGGSYRYPFALRLIK